MGLERTEEGTESEATIMALKRNASTGGIVIRLVFRAGQHSINPKP
jgi:hypothetical protein